MHDIERAKYLIDKLKQNYGFIEISFVIKIKKEFYIIDTSYAHKNISMTFGVINLVGETFASIDFKGKIPSLPEIEYATNNTSSICTKKEMKGYLNLSEIIVDNVAIRDHYDICENDLAELVQISNERKTNIQINQIEYYSVYLNSFGSSNIEKKVNYSGGFFGKFVNQRNFFENDWNRLIRGFLKEKLSSNNLKSNKIFGEYEVVFSSQVASIFFHEIGHLLEYGTWCIREGQKISNISLNIWNKTNAENGYSNYMFDNEGIKGENTKLIENGVVISNIHSKITALQNGKSVNGYGRITEEDSRVRPRMAQIFVENSKINDLSIISSVKSGIYIEEAISGQTALRTQSVRIKCKKAKKIYKGILLEEVCVDYCGGNAIELLDNILAVGSESYCYNGMCSGELPVSYESPIVHIKKVKIW